MNEGDVARENRWRIARILRIQQNRSPVSGATERRFHHLLYDASKTPSADAYRRLEGLARQIQPYRRDLEVCLVLLNRLWILPADSQLEADVVQLIRECYVRCERKSHRLVLGEELRERQWSPFPAVRRAACRIRAVERVDVEEVKLLHPGPGFSDLRLAVAERALLHRQDECLAAILGYMVAVVESPQVDEVERLGVMRLFDQLRGLPLEVTVVPLYQRYLVHFGEQETRGLLMRALSAYGDALVPMLVRLSEEGPSGRRPIQRLLRQMIAHGNPRAAEALGEIVLKGDDGLDSIEACNALLSGAREQAARGFVNDRTQQIRDYLENLCLRLETAPLPQKRALAKELKALDWESGTSPELIERLLAGVETPEERNRLRGGGRRAYDLLAVAASSPQRTEDCRIRAVQAISRLYSRHHRQDAWTLMWRLFGEESSERLRCEALKCMAKLGQEPAEAVRRKLFEDHRNGTATVRKVIIDIWPKLFPHALPPDRTSASIPTRSDG